MYLDEIMAATVARCFRCSKSTSGSALRLLSSEPARPYPVILEQIHQMGSVPDPKLSPGSARLLDEKPLRGKTKGEIRVALIRPLGSMSDDEEKVKVHQMCEPYQQEMLAQALINEGYRMENVRVFDQLAAPFDPNNPSAYPTTKTNGNFVHEIESFNPDVVCIGTFTYNFRRGLAIAAQLKQDLGIPIVFGGYHATSVGIQYLIFNAFAGANPQGAEVFKEDLRLIFQHGIVDCACIGEGIRVLPDILAVLRGEKEPREVRGIAYSTDDGTIHITAAERVPLEEYPLPYRSGDFDPMMYYSTGRRYPMLLMSTASGCRFSCEFCSTGVIYHGLSYRSVESVVRELQLIKERFHPTWPARNGKIMVNFTDEDFAANPRRIIELCNAIITAGLQDFFEFNSFLDNDSILGTHPRTRQVDPRRESMAREMLVSMRRAGFVYCFVGIESMDELILNDYHRPDMFSDRISMIQAAIDRMGQYGPAYFGDYISGHPFHTIKALLEDHARVLELRRMHFAYFPILAPMPGTPLYWRILWGALGEGFLDGATYDQLDANHHVLQLDGGGDVMSVRNATVQHFFTRPEYEQDVMEIARTKPRLGELIASTLAKLSSDHPSNQGLRELAKKLGYSIKSLQDK